MMAVQAPPRWEDLPPWEGVIDGSDQVLIVASTKGGKSTLAATLLLDVPSLVAIDTKGQLMLPRAVVVQLPAYRPTKNDDDADEGVRRYDEAIRDAIRWREQRRWTGLERLTGRGPGRPTNRVILRPYVLDNESRPAHDRIFRAIFLYRPGTIVWVDEITGTGSTAQASPRWLRAISARGRTRQIGLWTMTQSPYGLVPGTLKRNARIMLFGPIEPEDAKDIHRPNIEIATEIPPATGRFLLYEQGDRQPYRLQMPIPAQLRHWRAP